MLELTKVVINRCFGGFNLSDEVHRLLGSIKDGNYWDTSTWDQGHYIDALAFRVLPDLVAAVELLGEAANGDSAELEVVSVPSDADIYISDYDGVETIREGRVWPADRYPGRR
jgi:hypothetical protein